MGREKSENIRERRKVENINDWLLSRKEKWNEDINRMDNEIIVRATREKWGDKLTVL